MATADQFLEAVRLDGSVTTGQVAGTITGSGQYIHSQPCGSRSFRGGSASRGHRWHALTFTVTASNPFNNAATGYTGTVNFASSDTAAILPPGSTLVSGVGTFTASLATLGSQTLTVTDTLASTLTGTSGGTIVTGPPPISHSLSQPIWLRSLPAILCCSL